MKKIGLVVAMAVVTLMVVALSRLGWAQSSSPNTAAANAPLSHSESGFEFTVAAQYKSVAPLFGALGERCWGGDDWNPEFVYPSPAADKPGAVFTLSHGNARSTWINTIFDLKSGHIQYVYLLPNTIAVLVEINVRSQGEAKTAVNVQYQRTALRPEINPHITELAKHDEKMGQEWAEAIAACLKAPK